MFDSKRIPLTKALVFIVLLASLTFFGCIGPRGWAGTTVDGDALLVGSMDGRVVRLDLSARQEKREFPADGEWEWEPDEESSAGLFDCTSRGQFAGGKIYGDPVRDGDFVYIGTYAGNVYAIDARDPTNVHTEWSYDTDSSIVGGIAVANGAVYVGASDGKLYALEAIANGSEGRLREGFEPFETGDKIWSTPLVDGGIVYFGSLDHKLYAIDAFTGEPVWDEPFVTGGAIASTPLIVDGVLYFGAFDSKFYAVYASSGEAKWTSPFEADNWFWTRAVYDTARSAVYACSLDHKVYSIDAETGEARWDEPFVTDSTLLSAPVMSAGIVVVASEKGSVYGLNPDTGEEQWSGSVDVKGGIHAPLTAQDGKVYVNALNNDVHSLLAGDDGRTEWSLSL
jgi:outer membrane protein assembly factor BamB